MTVAPDGQHDCGELLIAARAVLNALYDPTITSEATFNALPRRAFLALQGLREEVEGRRANVVEV